VVVYEIGPNETVVAAMAPLAALGIAGEHADLRKVAQEADGKLRRALAALESGGRRADAAVTAGSSREP
jgi:hypothetical protein